MSRPSILFLSTSLNIGGTELFLSALVEDLRKEYAVSVGYIKEKGIVGRRLERNGVEVRHLPSPWKIIEFVRSRKTDAIHTFLYRANIIGRVAGRLAGVPVILSTQQSIDRWKKRRHVWLDSVTARWCSRIIANSRTTARLLEEREGIPADRISVVYNGLSPACYSAARDRTGLSDELGLPPSRRIIVTVSRLHPEKGADLLPLIAERVPDASFVVVGDGPSAETLTRMISAAGLSGRFFLTGWRDDIPAVLAASDVFLLPSREESLPQAVLEAMAAGLPVVAADVGGLHEIVADGRTGRLVSPEDIDGFAEALNALLADGQKAEAMGEAGRERSGEFSEERMLRSVRNIYGELLGRQA